MRSLQTVPRPAIHRVPGCRAPACAHWRWHLTYIDYTLAVAEPWLHSVSCLVQLPGQLQLLDLGCSMKTAHTFRHCSLPCPIVTTHLELLGPTESVINSPVPESPKSMHLRRRCKQAKGALPSISVSIVDGFLRSPNSPGGPT